MKPQGEQRKNIKVVHLNASSAGGAFVAAQRLSSALDQLPDLDSSHWVFEGGEGDFFLWANSWLKSKWAFALHAFEKLDFLRFEREKSVRFAFSHGKTGVNVAAWESIVDADVIHLHWINKGFISLAGLEDLLKLNKRLVWTCHDMWPFTGGCYHPRGCDHFQAECGNCHYLKSPAEEDLSRRVFSAKQEIYKAYGDHLQFVTPSKWLKDQALKSGALTSQLRDSIQVVPNPIDTDYFYPANNERGRKDPEQYESAEGLINGDNNAGDKKFTLMFAAANLGNAAKGFAEFRTLCNSLVAKGYTNIEALVVGENRIGDLGLNCAHTALGFIADAQKMRNAYWKTDVYVTTSHEENLPTTIMESLSCGVPVAAFSVGGIPEMVDVHGSGKTGWLAPKLDVEVLVKQIAAYIELSPAERSAIQNNCREAALNRYSATSISKDYEAIYRA